MSNQDTITIGIDDSYYFVHAVNLLKGWDSIIPFTFTKDGFKIIMQNQKLKNKQSDMLVRLYYPVYNLIDYKISNKDAKIVIKVDGVMFDEKTKGIKQADNLRFFTRKDVNSLFYDFNNTASSEMKIHQDLIGDPELKFPTYNEVEPIIVINKIKYTNIATDLKRLKKQHIFDAAIYKNGIKFTYYNYGVKIPTISTLGVILEDEKPAFNMVLDAQFFLFAQSKMSKLFPDKSPIKFYATNTGGVKTLIIRIPVGCTGNLDISYSNTE